MYCTYLKIEKFREVYERIANKNIFIDNKIY